MDGFAPETSHFPTFAAIHAYAFFRIFEIWLLNDRV